MFPGNPSASQPPPDSAMPESQVHLLKQKPLKSELGEGWLDEERFYQV